MPMTQHVKDFMRQKHPNVSQEVFKYVEAKQRENDIICGPAFTEADVDRLVAEHPNLARIARANAKTNAIKARRDAEEALKKAQEAEAFAAEQDPAIIAADKADQEEEAQAKADARAKAAPVAKTPVKAVAGKNTSTPPKKTTNKKG